MRPSNLEKKDINESLSSRLRAAVIFSPKEARKGKVVSDKTAEKLHTIISQSMQEIYKDHVEQKKLDLERTLKNRELLYIDASKKGDMDIFFYIARTYFNNSSPEARDRYNELVYNAEEICEDDRYWQTEFEENKRNPMRDQQGSDSIISFLPFQPIRILALINNDQQDLNIFFDNIESLTDEEFSIINSAIRGGLLMSSSSWMGLYINNTKNGRKFIVDKNSLPPQDGHDMRIVYI